MVKTQRMGIDETATAVHDPRHRYPRADDLLPRCLRPLQKILQQIGSDPLISGVTFSGGEPFCQAAALCELGERVRALGKNIVVYSGYTFEELLEKGKTEPDVLYLLRLCDLLIDGRYVESLRDLSLQFRGSSNQRLIDLKKEFAEPS